MNSNSDKIDRYLPRESSKVRLRVEPDDNLPLRPSHIPLPQHDINPDLRNILYLPTINH